MRGMGLATKRDVRTFSSVTLNNLFLFAALLTYSALASGMKPLSAVPFYILLLFIIIFPLSIDPLKKIPPNRMASWPLTQSQLIGLRVASLGLSPVLWIGLVILVATRRWILAILFMIVALVAQLVTTVGALLLRHVPSLHPFRSIPALPGQLGGLIRNNVRQILSTLDFYPMATFHQCVVTYDARISCGMAT